MESGLSELGFWRLTAESATKALDSRQSPFVESEERPAPHVDFLAPIRLATRAWVAEKRDYRVLRHLLQYGCSLLSFVPLALDCAMIVPVRKRGNGNL